MKGPVIFLVGQMCSGSYREEFEKAEEYLRAYGFSPVNPARFPEGLDKKKEMQLAISGLMCADAVLILHEWYRYPLAELERQLAVMSGIPTYKSYEDLLANVPRSFGGDENG